MKTKICKQCTLEYQTKNKVFCSEKCQHEYLKGKKKDDKWEKHICLYCNVEFERLKYKIKKQECCSRKCVDQYKKSNKSGIFDPKNRIKKFSEETKLKHSIITKELWKDNNFKEKVKNGQLEAYKKLGHWAGTDQNSKEKRKKTNLLKYGNEYIGWNIPYIRKKAEETCLNKYGKKSWEIAQSQKNKYTSIENIVALILSGNSIPFLTQYKVFYTEKKYKIYDFFLPKSLTLIEVDGDYWHGNPMFFSKLNKTQLINKSNDIFKNELAEQCGLNLKRYWENEVHNIDFETKFLKEILDEQN
jgi:hypothetical protein